MISEYNIYDGFSSEEDIHGEDKEESDGKEILDVIKHSFGESFTSDHELSESIKKGKGNKEALGDSETESSIEIKEFEISELEFIENLDLN